MADRSYTIKKGINGIYHRVEFGESVVSNLDTLTFSNFLSTTGLLNAAVFKKSDGTTLGSTTGVDNRLLISGAGTNIAVVYMVYGVKA